MATELRQRIQNETGLPISFGLSKNKTVSKVATGEAKPNGQLQIDFGKERNFLSPLMVDKIPMIGQKTSHLLKSMGVYRVKTLQEMPIELMQNMLGQNGAMVWKKANAIDNTPVQPYTERKSLSTEETFDRDTTDVAQLKSILVAMTEKLAFQMRREEKLTSCVTVKIRYSNFDTHSKQIRIPYTSCDHILIPQVKELFDKVFERRMLIRLIGVRFSHLVRGSYQIHMFDDTEEMMRLYQAMDKMRKRFGDDKIQRAVTKGHSFRRFNPFNGQAA